MNHNLIISDVVKEYPKMVKIYIYHNNYVISRNPAYPRIKLNKEQKKHRNSKRSLRRTKNIITDLIICNKFDYWATFTFNPDKYDRFDMPRIKSVMSLWLARQRFKNSEFKYLVVPEFHKDGALHFHALLSNLSANLTDSGHKTKTGQTIYNIKSFRAGFPTAIPLTDNNLVLASYMKKYITKDMPLLHAQKRYWVSRDLVRPTSIINGVSKFKLHKLIYNYPPDYITDFYELQIHNKNSKLPTFLTSDEQTMLL